MENFGYAQDAADGQNGKAEKAENSLELRLQHTAEEDLSDSDNIPKKKTALKLWMERRKVAIRYGALAVLNMAVFAYFFAALNYWYTKDLEREWEFCDGFGLLLILMSIVYFFLLYYIIVKRFFGRVLERMIVKPVNHLYGILWEIRFFRWGTYLVLLGALIVFLVLDTDDSRERLISMIGLLFLLAVGYVFSFSRSNIVWRPVVWGVALQFIMGLLTIRWKVGRDIFQCLGDKVSTFLLYSKAGSSFVYSEYLVEEIGVFAFQVLSVIYFFSLMIEILFYWGAMQWVCLKMGWCLQVTMGTTVCESVICAANTFLGMSESPLLIRPYIPDLTRSELHAIMCSGFATVSGTVLAAYISFGVQPAHLITASVMSAPAALCYAKLFYPEVEQSKTAVGNIKIHESDDSSVLDAAAKGASNGTALVLNIAANLIGFVSLVAFINAVLQWLGMLLGWDFLTLEWLFGKVFIPLSWVMGVPWDECELVGQLIGLKTIVNEFVAYKKLGEYKEEGLLSNRGEAIATFALCGFTNPSSIGIMVGALSAMAPTRRKDIAGVAVRGLIAGCAVCFMTACIAGLLITPGAYDNIISNKTSIVY